MKPPPELKILQELQKNKAPTAANDLAGQHEWQQNVCAKCIVYKNLLITLGTIGLVSFWGNVLPAANQLATSAIISSDW